jgi:large subunit ribosomal protein L3
MTGHFGAANVDPVQWLREIRCDAEESLKAGDELRAENVFQVGQIVKITGVTKGKGFAGGIKRHGFHGGKATHGSKVHRAPQSTGATDPARVFAGVRKPGHMGAEQYTMKGATIVKIDTGRNLLLVKGAVPGATGGLLIITAS